MPSSAYKALSEEDMHLASSSWSSRNKIIQKIWKFFLNLSWQNEFTVKALNKVEGNKVSQSAVCHLGVVTENLS